MHIARVCAIYESQSLARPSITHGWAFCWQKGRREQTIADALQQWFVKSSLFFPLNFSQIGSNVFLTAAHCLENWAGEVQTPSQLKIILAVQNRSKLTSRARCWFICDPLTKQRKSTYKCILTTRELHVTEVVLHKDFNFTRHVNDIALLKTSKNLIQP